MYVNVLVFVIMQTQGIQNRLLLQLSFHIWTLSWGVNVLGMIKEYDKVRLIYTSAKIHVNISVSRYRERVDGQCCVYMLIDT